VMESRFNHDFADVRIHRNDQASTAAEALGANAFTTGRDIYFAKGTYQPGTTEGDRLLAHELTHTVQQSEASASAADKAVSEPGDQLEIEAERTADQVVAGQTAPTVSRTTSLLARDPTKDAQKEK